MADEIQNTTPASPSSGGSKMMAIAAIVIVLLAAAVYAQNRREKSNTETMPQGNATTTASGTPEVVPAPTTATDAKVVTVTVKGSNFAFAPNVIRVKKGQTVRVVFENTGGFHDLVIDEFNVRTKQIQGGASETVEFVASKTGSFEYYCSVGTHREMGMKGRLVVE